MFFDFPPNSLFSLIGCLFIESCSDFNFIMFVIAEYMGQIYGLYLEKSLGYTQFNGWKWTMGNLKIRIIWYARWALKCSFFLFLFFLKCIKSGKKLFSKWFFLWVCLDSDTYGNPRTKICQHVCISETKYSLYFEHSRNSRLKNAESQKKSNLSMETPSVVVANELKFNTISHSFY